MYYLLDLDNLCVLRAHSNSWTIADLAVIECPEIAYAIGSFDNIKTLFTYTEMELGELYHKITGHKKPANVTGNDLRALVVEAIQRIPECDANPSEVDGQAAWLEANPKQRAKGGWRYVKGSNRPTQGQPLLLQAPPASDTQAAIAAGHAMGPRPSTTTPPKREPGATPASPSPRPAGEPRQVSAPRGGVRQIIWDKADAMWENAGRPTGKSEVLSLRKLIMDELEKDGVKRTSSSNELGNWQKSRITA